MPVIVSHEDLNKKQIFLIPAMPANIRQQAKQVLLEILVHPGMAKPVRLRFKKRDDTFCVIKGIMSNVFNNPLVGKIVLNGWME
ncbi:MAG: hypothetical protein Q7V05_16655 [Methanoregula sp.]|nr:hypothetical protein [Methanoregula sp.]